MQARGGIAVLTALVSLLAATSCSGSDLECGAFRGPRNELVVLDRTGGAVLRTRRAPDARFLSRDGTRLAAAASVERQGADDRTVVATVTLRGSSTGADHGDGRRVRVGTTTVERFAFSGPDERHGVRAVDDGRLRWELPVAGDVQIAAADADAVALIEEVDVTRSRFRLVALADGEVRWTTELSGSIVDGAVLTDQELGALVGARAVGCG